MKTTTIQKWGNSYAVRIPVEEIERFHLSEGQSVLVRQARDGKSISITPASARDLTLGELASRITVENKHSVFDWGSAVGREVW